MAAAPDGEASSGRTTSGGVDETATDEGQIALNLLRRKIPKLEEPGRSCTTADHVRRSAIDGKSIAQLIDGKPLFPPVEGLDKTVWDMHCTSCHQWKQPRLCEQATNYVKVDISIMRLDHPYGTRFKVALANWANEGCK